MNFIFGMIVIFGLVGCASIPKGPTKPPIENGVSTDSLCREKYESIRTELAMDSITRTIELFYGECDQEFLRLAPILRDHYRDKVYSVSKDGSELVAKAGSRTEYVFEAHERTFISFLIAASYYRLGKKDAAAIELRRMRDEQNAMLYNWGEDSANVTLQATLWENLGEMDSARPFWRKLAESSVVEERIKTLSKAQLERLDRGQKVNWRISSVGTFPELQWDFSSSDLSKSYYRVNALGDFAKSCVENQIMVVSTEPWLKEMQDRYDVSKHPAAFAGTVSRGVVGATFSGVVTLTGVGLGLTVCAIGKNADLCSQAIQIGAAIAIYGMQATGTYLSPDIRHIHNLPAGVMISPVTETGYLNSGCAQDAAGKIQTNKILVK